MSGDAASSRGDGTGTRIPDPALVVLVGPSGSGKSTWAAERYRAEEVVSSDALRAVVGSGTADLDASADAFRLLDQVVTARVGRRLTTVVDTLGTDGARRRTWLAAAREASLPAVVVVVSTPVALARERNRRRDRPVPAATLTAQHQRHATVADEVAGEGWDLVVTVTGDTAGSAGAGSAGTGSAGTGSAGAGSVPGGPAPAAGSAPEPVARDGGPELVLQVSAFPWGEDPLGWLTGIARAAEQAGFNGLALMDHLIQIPQVGRAWDPIPEPWVTLGALAGLGTGLRLGTLVSPVTFRAPGITAKAAATLDVLTGGRAFLGIGAGWWQREHDAYGLGFPPAARRLDELEGAIETIRALWATGTKPYAGHRVSLPETTFYPRPTDRLPIIVGGSGARTLAIAGRVADACNVPSDESLLAGRIEAVRRSAERARRDPDSVAVTVLDLPLVGTDRDDVWRRVERHRGRTSASSFAARHHAGTVTDHRERYRRLAELGVSTVFLAPVGLAGPDDVLALGPLSSG